MHGNVIFTSLLVSLVIHGTSQADPAAEDLAPSSVSVLPKTDICLHRLGLDPPNVKANVFWKAPRIVRSPIVAYAIHAITKRGYDITIRVDSTTTEQPVDVLQCWEVYSVRVEALFESGESAVSPATVVYVADKTAKFLPQRLNYTENRGRCHLTTGCQDSIELSWRHPDLGQLNVTGYMVSVTTSNGTQQLYSLAPGDNTFKYDNLGSNGTTTFGVSARTLLEFVSTSGVSHAPFNFPPAYVSWSRENKAYIVPAAHSTTHPSETTPVSSDGYSTTTKRSSSTESHTTGSQEYDSTTQTAIEATTSFDNVEPAASGVSTTTILCSVLIPLAIIVLGILAFFGYKKYKQAGSQGLLSNSDDP